MVSNIQKYFRKLTPKQRTLVFEKLERLSKNGLSSELDVKPLKSKKGIYRLRVGKIIRIIFYFDKNKNVIVLEADNRGSIY